MPYAIKFSVYFSNQRKLQIPLDDCGTKVYQNKSIVFKNKIFPNLDALEVDGIRTADFLYIHVECKYDNSITLLSNGISIVDGIYNTDTTIKNYGNVS